MTFVGIYSSVLGQNRSLGIADQENYSFVPIQIFPFVFVGFNGEDLKNSIKLKVVL